MKDKSRNNSIDILKCLCAFLVICIHIPFPGELGKFVVTITRIAVPIFFMISGFFWENTCLKKKEGKTIKKLLWLAILGNVFYFIVNLIFMNGFSNIERMFSLKSLIKFIFFNSSPFSDHLWYLSAILYVTIIVFLLDKFNLRERANYMIPFLLIIDLLFGKYSLLIFHREFPYILLRNFLFVGLPFFLIGTLLFKYKEKIKEKCSLKLLLILTIITIVFNCLERYLLEINSLNALRDQYIFTTILAVLVFDIAIVLNIRKDNIISKVGRKYSMMIYLIHPFIIILLKNISWSWLSYIEPIVVFILAIMFSWVYYSIKEMIVKKFK